MHLLDASEGLRAAAALIFTTTRLLGLCLRMPCRASWLKVLEYRESTDTDPVWLQAERIARGSFAQIVVHPFVIA